jgi:hypothetical protein
MKPVPTILAVVLVLVAAACGSSSPSAAPASSSEVPKRCDQREFGHIQSLTRKGDHFELRFDPAWFTSGVTANTAAAEDGQVEPGEPVPNDNYVVDESHRLLTYLVPTTAHATVLINNATGILSTPISVSELAEIVSNGKSSQHTLFEALDSGVWIRFAVDTVCSLDQQYRP